MSLELPVDITTIKGFLESDEGEALHHYALETGSLGPCLEVGSYCGKSTVYLGYACKLANSTLFAIDHHRGSEEHQLGEEYHDRDLYDTAEELMDSFREFRRTLRRADLEDCVVPIVAASKVAARSWITPLGMVFIDGGHSLDAAMVDYLCWMPRVVPGGILAIHDIFADPSEGGQAPFTIYKMALASGLFDELPRVNTLGLLRRVN